MKQVAREADESGRRSHEINKKKQERLFDKNSRNDVTMKSDKDYSVTALITSTGSNFTYCI